MTTRTAEPSTSVDRPELERLFVAMARIRASRMRSCGPSTRERSAGPRTSAAARRRLPVGVCEALGPPTCVAATYRGHGAALALGCDPEALFAEFLGRESGICGGRGGSMNVIDLEHRLLGCFGIVGGSIGAATGAALACAAHRRRQRGGRLLRRRSAQPGLLPRVPELRGHAAASRSSTPARTTSTASGRTCPRPRPAAGSPRAPRPTASARRPSTATTSSPCARRREARRACPRGRGPAFVEFLTYRHHGHSRSDPAKYRPREEVDALADRDPLLRLAIAPRRRGRSRLRAEAEREMQAALDAGSRAAALGSRAAPPRRPRTG